MKNGLLILGTLVIMSACSTSKFDYNTAYKFSQYKDNVEQEQEQQQEVSELTAIASLKPVIPVVRALPPDAALKESVTSDATTAVIEEYKNASRVEKKAIRKQVKQEYKTLRKEVKEAKKDEVTKDIVFNKKMYIGAVILAAGILVAILASGGVGAVGIIVGIGLMAWGLIEQS